MTFSYVKIELNMDEVKIKLHQKLRKIETIFFWILFILFFAFSIAFLFISFLSCSNIFTSLTISFVIVAGVMAVLIIFIYIYGASKFQKITDKVDNYIRNKEYQEGIKYIRGIKDITYFFISFDKIYYYLGILYLYDSNKDEASKLFILLVNYSKSDILVTYNSIKYLGLIYLINNNQEGINNLNEKYLSLRRKAASFKTINKYTNSDLLFLYSIIEKITSDEEEKKKDALKTYIGIPLIQNYLDKKEKK